MTTLRGQEAGPVHGDDAQVGFKSHMRPETVPGQAVYLVSQRGLTALHGNHAQVLVPLLDGSRTPAEVVRDAAPALSADEARASLRALDAAGLLRQRATGGRTTGGRTTGDRAGANLTSTDVELQHDPAAEAFWDLLGADGGQAPATLARRRVRIVSLLDADLLGPDAAPVRAAFEGAGLSLTTHADERADLSVVLCDDYLSPRLAEVDAAHRREGTPWMPVRLEWSNPWTGPLFQPDEGPCWHCLATRLRGHRHSEGLLQHLLDRPDPVALPPATLPVVRGLALHLAALEAAKWLAGVRDPSQSSLHALDTSRLGLTAHPVARRPQCPACGDPDAVRRQVEAPFVPVSRPKVPGTGNGHRSHTPEQMLALHGHLVDPVTGIVKDIRRAPGSPAFLNTFLSGRNLAMPSHSLEGLRAGLRSLSGGKGLTETEARVSALCEAVERYSGTRQGDEPVVHAAFHELGPAAIHPHDSQLYSERQFLERDSWNASGSRLNYVPAPFDEKARTEWTPVWSLTGNEQRFLPTSLLYFGAGEASDGLFADSNGNAAGSSREDAVVQGFLELVERDAVALWWYNRTRQPSIDLAAFDEPYIAQLVDGYGELNREVWALDLTSDFGIPVVVAVSRRTDKPAEDVIFGFGAHFDPRLALRRALTEMGQLLPVVTDVTPEGTGYRITDPEPLQWWRTATVANQPYLTADPGAAARRPDDWPPAVRADLLDDVVAITELVRSRGLELLVLDQTRPDLGIPVVKVIVPGMRHFWARFAPGRLFDIPVTLGRLDAPLQREFLNPVPLFV
ncbi:TOMM precursor leader peptide-binding protein [Streptomyces sp. NBC_00237]|uniref:TOMM precursor leader peptide-binding protein n=1 Tax=Streptomyces sp. NBC_00237 TaxID=2975687 RepID=UPI002252C119|nr:TOMM precursor leader peptide-binding protein [Streptomyces sp. NBC_00237]MCX5206929.1 TOMM precursor leader peptide-binding protein [Streptomyces sp. NBC_00237]